MEEQLPSPGEQPKPEGSLPPAGDPVPAAAPAPVHAHPAGPRRLKWRMMVGLLVLYLGSLGAATILILRTPTPGHGKAGGGKDEGFSSLLTPPAAETVGWVRISGPIYDNRGDSLFDKGSRSWVKRIRALSETKGVKAIVLDINSPGGSIGAVQEIYSQIQRIKKEKNIPFVAMFGDISASGGYYLGAACDKIVAHPGTLTGSIGVIFNMANMEGLFKKIGYKSNPIKSGKHKDIGSSSRPMTAEEKKILQDLIDEAYGQFVDAISTGRGMDPEVVRKLADGRIYSGSQALENGLIDMLGDSIDALELAGKLGGIEGRPKIHRETDSIRGFLNMLEASFGGASPTVKAFLDRLPPPYVGLEYRWAGL